MLEKISKTFVGFDKKCEDFFDIFLNMFLLAIENVYRGLFYLYSFHLIILTWIKIEVI